ncbi:efflux RND transporter periplasmic adaptor subunit [Granulicella arctica]|uniref:HlyD family secretion protein n=1 Tax=Granulicella arctica TaxID=940613 RepID=A0A7Y9PHE4_9BACT|nr:efflux RND transporter periplasmic adaptor subunit [Granulicella arctica]NYF79877.1 HlyD family secretion protein [Granulicella arctica]
MPTSEKRFNPATIWGSLIVVALLAGLLIRSLTREIVSVRVAPVTHQNLLSTVSTNGKVEPIDEYQAHAPAPGVVEQIYVDVGQKIKVGELLVKMDDSDAVARMASANASLKSAEASHSDLQQGGTQDERLAMQGDLSRAQLQQQQATKDLAALQLLEQKGAASASEVASAKQRLESANSTFQGLQQRSTQRYSATDRSRSEAQILEAKASLASARSSFAGANIRSPIAGTVYSIPVSQYDFVPAGEDLLDVADLNRIQIRAYFDEPEIGKLAEGQSVKIVWDAKPLQIWHGHISLAPTTVITYNTRNVGECIITVDDAKGDLLPNTNVTVTVTTSQRFNVLSIPREALHTDSPTKNYVYRVVDHKLVWTPVQVGVVNLNRVEITGGLTEKDTIALNATSNRDLSNGLEVKPVE